MLYRITFPLGFIDMGLNIWMFVYLKNNKIVILSIMYSDKSLKCINIVLF